MLFTYDVSSNADNWIHNVLMSTINDAIVEIDANRDYITWPNMIPKAHRTKLSSRTSLGRRIVEFLDTYRALDGPSRQIVKDALIDQNDLQALFQNTKECLRSSQLPVSIQQPAQDLFTVAFKLLTPLKLRDQQYRKIHSKMRDKVCPFCGCEQLDPPGLPRHDLDHYLARTIYPFAAANLNNLAPMGDRCNKAYKKRQDMLLGAGNAWRKCSDPFRGPTAKVSLLRSTPYQRKNKILPNWRIDLEDDCEEIQTWDSVFSIKRRWSKAVLDQEYNGWLDDFGQWSKKQRLPKKVKSAIPGLLRDYIDACVPEKFTDRSFLKRAMFSMLHAKCSDPLYGDDIKSHLEDIIALP